MIESDYDYTCPRRGRLYEAVVLHIGKEGVIVDLLGTKRDGLVPLRDLKLLDGEERATLQVGDHIPVVVLKESGHEGNVIVSLNKGLEQEDWERARKLLESEETVEARVEELNRGGVIVSFGRLEGFVPNSHLTSVPRRVGRERLKEAKSKLAGQTLSLAVIEASQRRRCLVLSERVAERCKRQQLLEELAEGDVRTGVVRSLTGFGAFVDLGGLDGLIHVSELDWGYVEHPSEVLSVDEEVEVYVLSVDREQERVALSRKQLLPDPWRRVSTTLREGEIVEGTVTSVVPFGVFVDIGEGIEGLVHTSEMPAKEITPWDLESGSEVSVRVLEVDEWEGHIALRLEEVN